MDDELDGRRVFTWHGRDEDTNRLADVVAEQAKRELFNLNGILVWLDEGRTVPCNINILREVIARHVVDLRLVNRGAADAPTWDCEYRSFAFPVGANTREEPDEKVLIALSAALLLRVAKGPSKPHKLSEQQEREVRMRLNEGEPRDRIADAYGVDAATIGRVAR